MSDYRVLLYYKYIDIEDPETLKNDHLAYCKDLGVLGRIYVSEEGINGTLSGTVEQTDKYMEDLQADPRIGKVSFKIDEADGHAFKKMKVKVRNELASLHLEDYYDIDDVDPNSVEEDLHLDPAEFRQALLDDDVVVIDTRNDYEYEVGHFRGAINPDIPAFHQFPKWFMDNKEKFMDKKVVIYCTGGIRCEKLAVWMTKEGVDTRQLRNGIHNYSTDPETQGDLWDGKMYVFDERLVVPINHVEETIVGRDHFDGSPCERYVNCGNPWCNKQFLCSEENEHKYLRGCTHECRVHPDNRYVAEHALSEAEVNERLEAIGEDLVGQA